MRIAALLLGALMLLPALPAEALPTPPLPVDPQDVSVPFFLRKDPDGARTLTLLIEDPPEGTYTYRPMATNPQFVREVGTYLHPWDYQGKPEVTLGVYSVDDTNGMLRVPVLVMEHVASETELLLAFEDAVLRDGLGMVGGVVAFLLEIAAPDTDGLGEEDLLFQDFVTRPVIAAWTVRRVLPGAEVWAGSYLEHVGSSWEVPGGREGLRSQEIGVLSRIDGQDQRLGGIYTEQFASSTSDATSRHLYSKFTAGAATPAGRVPLASAEGEDTRTGQRMDEPREQVTTVTVGAETPLGFVPLAGLRLEMQHRHHEQGVEVTQLTSAGVFVDGAWTPVVGTRYHAERTPMLDFVAEMLEGGGLGSQNVGDFEYTAGVFVQGAYKPVVQASYDDHFAGARLPYQAMVQVGLITPAAYLPLAAATYEGSQSLLVWAGLFLGAGERDTYWLVSAGPFVGQLYSPVVGLRFRGEAPGAEEAHEGELALGVFVLSYTRFLPLVAVGYASDDSLLDVAQDLANHGPGSQGSDWMVDLGTYLPVTGKYLSLVRVATERVPTAEDPASTDTTVYAASTKVLGMQYRGAVPLVDALGDPFDPADDQRFRLAVGVFVQDKFIPLVRVYHDAHKTTVVVGPDITDVVPL